MSTVFEKLFRTKAGHTPLFRNLCKQMELDKKTFRLLNRIASEIRPNEPAMIFVDPSVLREGIKLPDVAESTDSVEMLRELYFKWFGGAI